MYAVSTAAARTADRTIADAVSAAIFGKLPLTARGFTGNRDWLAFAQSVRDHPAHRPSASGHGHRP